MIVAMASLYKSSALMIATGRGSEFGWRLVRILKIKRRLETYGLTSGGFPTDARGTGRTRGVYSLRFGETPPKLRYVSVPVVSDRHRKWYEGL